MDIESFQDIFAVLLQVYDKRDSSGLMTLTYFKLVMQSDPTAEELFAALEEFIGNRQDKFPSAAQIKELIWEARNRKKPALPMGKTLTDNPRQAKIDLLRGIYLDQGDTPFYRSILKAGAYMGIPLPYAKVSHEDILAACSEA